jgi:FtsP/CotA-like multicopper oxidase with cupredoxin domain
MALRRRYSERGSGASCVRRYKGISTRLASIASLIVPLSLSSTRAIPGRITVNDNTVPAGRVSGGTTTIRLEARAGVWHPDREVDPGVEVLAFGEVGKGLQVPGPVIRATEGNDIVVTIRNASDTVLVVHGLYSRSSDGRAPADSVSIAANTVREVRFRAGVPGTYYYWASSGAAMVARPARETLLGGAIVIDPMNAPRNRNDRILVLNVWAAPAPARAEGERMRMVINGKAWPNTERLSYNVGDSVHWRVVNISGDIHPMHLHGFFYRVDGRGNEGVDSTYQSDALRQMVVTERMTSGRTMAMTWVPDRPGNWLFHCHDNFHIQTNQPLTTASAAAPRASFHNMGNLVMGVQVRGRAVVNAAPARRHLRLIARTDAGSTAEQPAYGYSLEDPDIAAAPRSLLPGPTFVLRRGEPVAITVVNELPEPTSVHWHGIELQSYYDGVARFSGAPKRLAPEIAPGDSFIVRFTPPRAGTFIYHTHVNDIRQQRAGLSGALLVLEPGKSYDPSKDIVLMLSTPRMDAEQDKVLLNGTLTPAPIEMRVGTPYRLRLINIHTYRPAMRVELKGAAGRESWRAIAKDGADLSRALATVRPAFFPLSNGETYDFEYTPAAPGELRLEVTAANGRVLVVQPMNVR